MDALYRAIGEFVVKFEHACFGVQLCIVFLLDRAGLRDQRVTQILLAGVTAEPLRALFQSLVAQTQTLNDREKKMVENALNRLQRLTFERNDIVHSTWFVGAGNDTTTDFSEAIGMKYHKNKEGAAPKSFNRTASDFEMLTAEADELAQVFLRLNGCFVGGFSVERNFVLSADGRVSIPAGVVG